MLSAACAQGEDICNLMKEHAMWLGKIKKSAKKYRKPAKDMCEAGTLVDEEAYRAALAYMADSEFVNAEIDIGGRLYEVANLTHSVRFSCVI